MAQGGYQVNVYYAQSLKLVAAVNNPYSFTARTPGSGIERHWLAFRWGESRGVLPGTNFFVFTEG